MLTQAPPPGPALGGPPEKPADDEQSRALAKTCIVEAFRKLDPSEKGWVPRHAFVQVVCLLFFPLSERDANKLLAASGALTGKDECVNYLLFAEWIMSVPRTPRQEATVEAAVVEAAVVEADPGAAAPEGDDLTLSLSKPLSEQTWLPSSPSPQHGSTPPEGDAQESSYECMEGEQQKSAPMKASIGRPVVDVAAPAMQQKAAPPPAAPAGLTPSQLAGALEDLARRWEAAAPEARLPQEEAESFFGAGCAAECAELLRRWHAGSGTDAAALAARYPDDEGGRRALLDDAQALAAEPLVQEADRRLRLAKYARRPPKEVEWQRPPSEDAAEEDFDPGSSAARIDLAFARMLRTWDQASDEVESSPRVFSKDERGTPSHSQFAPEPPPSLQKSAPPPPRAAPTVVARAAPVEPPAQQAHTRAGRANQAGVAVALRLTSLLQEEVMCGPEGAWADRLQASTRAELGALLELLSSPSAADLVDLLSGKTAAPPPLPGATDDMVQNFTSTTKILLNRIKELESELSATQLRPGTSTAAERPDTAAVIERMEGGKAPPPARRHAPEVLRIEEEEPADEGEDEGGAAGDAEEICGNCGRAIPGGNLVSHSVFCYRNNFRCTACDEVIALRDKDSHMQTWTDPLRLVEAASRRDVETVRRMAEHGADFGTTVHPQTRDTVLHAAARVGDVELVSYFMGYGVDVDPVNNAGETPLHLAAESTDPQGDPRALRLLVELGSNLNLVNGQGDSALMLVCRRGAAAAAKYLVEQRADPQAQTKIGDTALQIAQRLGFQECVLALCTAGAPLRSGTPRSRARSGSPMPPQALPAREQSLPAGRRAASGGSGTPSASPAPSGRPASPGLPRPGAGGSRAAGYPPRPSRERPQPAAP